MSRGAYGAFISYRHIDPDRSWAKWLHANLETYRTPQPLVRTGIRARIGRVFRDEEELAASADLSESIENALRDSDYLIVVCSTRTPESRWVEQEVARFQALDRAGRILTLLIDGDPQNAFPEPLRVQEPLAADVRPRPDQSIRQIRETAKLRLLAAILGCRFDDLRQRELERQKRSLLIWSATSSLLLILVSALAVFAWTQRNRAEAEADRALREARIARAQMLAAQAQLSLATSPASESLGTTGPSRAILLSLEALRLAPVVEADSALRNGLAKLSQPASPAWLSIPADGFPGDAPPVPEEITSPDGRHRVRTSGNPGDYVTLEDLRAKRSWKLPHEWVLQAIRFSPDSRWLCTVTGRVSMDASEPEATVLYGSTVRVWEVAGGSLRTQVSLADQAGIVRAFFSPDGNTLATVNTDNQVRLWTLWPGQLEASACSQLKRNLSPTEWQRYLGNDPPRPTCPGLPIISE